MSHDSEWAHGICAMEVQGEKRSHCLWWQRHWEVPVFHPSSFSKLSMPCQKQGMKGGGVCWEKGSMGEG